MGKAKGGGFEREICKALSRWLSHGKREDLLWRSAGSGSRATVRLKQGGRALRSQCGDVMPTDKRGEKLTKRFFIEVKFYKDLDIAAFVLGRGGKLTKFWREARKQARAHGKYVMLIAKQNHVPTLVIVQHGVVSTLENSRRPLQSAARLGMVPKVTVREMNADIFYFDDMVSGECPL